MSTLLNTNIAILPVPTQTAALTPRTIPFTSLKPASRVNHSAIPIERLEARIAPAVLIVNAHTATYTDVDGDHVTIHVSTGDLNTAAFTTTAVGLGDQLELLDLHLGSFEGANLSFQIQKAGTGDGLTNVGAIDSTGQNLGKVSLPGDLGQIDVGTNSNSVPALKQLSVTSLGLFGLATQGGSGDLVSDINGSLGSLTVKTNLDGATIRLFGGSTIKLGSAFIGGSLLGNATASSGSLTSSGEIGFVRIGGDVIGGAGPGSGEIVSSRALGNVFIGGSLIGGSGATSGEVDSGTQIGSVKIIHDVIGGSGAIAGSIGTSGKLGSASIGGSVIGGAGAISGNITAGGDLGFLFIGGNLQGSSGDISGQIQTNGNVGSIRIGGSVLGGSSSLTGQIQLNGNVGSISIGGDVRGDTGILSGQIQANGTINQLLIGGSVLGSFGGNSGELQINETAGVVKIGHDLRGAAGASSGAILGGGDIGTLTIGGSVLGGVANSSGAILAGDIGSLSIGGSLQGGSITGSASLNISGEIEATHIGQAFIGGSIISGADNSTGTLTHNAGIRASQDIGSLVVQGSILGNTTASGNSPVIISAQGEATPSATHDNAVGFLAVGGQVKQTLILGGYSTAVDASDTRPAFANVNAQIGTVLVGGDWVASSLVAGAFDNLNNGFGNSDDSSGSAIAKIANIIIGGNVAGSSVAGDHYGFESHQIGSFHYSGYTAPLIPGTLEAFELSPITGDVTVREVM